MNLSVRRIAAALAALVVTVGLTSCGSSSSTSFCPDLATDAVLPAPLSDPAGLWDVTYSVSVVGGATVSTIQYRDGAGVLQTLTNPALPFTLLLFGKAAGTQVTLVVTAVAPPGTVIADTVAVTDAGGAHEQRDWQDTCGGLTN